VIIIEDGEVRIVPDLPSNYYCKEWRAYDQACDRAQEQGATYRVYHEARENQTFTPTLEGRVRSLLRLPLDS